MHLKKKLPQLSLSFLFLWVVSLNAQDDTLRIMQYNVLQLSSSSSSLARIDDRLKHIIKFTQPDILLLNEVTNSTAANYILSNALNVDGVNYYDKGNFNNASSLNNAMYYNTNKLTFVSQTGIPTAPRPTDGYRFYYNDPNLSYHGDTVFLDAYVVHLKAGSSSSDASQRNTAAIAIRNNLDAKSDTRNHILVGDFNVYNSTENAYQELLSTGNCQFYDPINTPGDWHATSAYAPIHTQSTNTPVSGGASGGMDDRFDFIITTGDLLNGSNNIEYVPGSYKAVGNDGFRFNKSLQSAPPNTQYPDSIVGHLYNMSDHVPVMADFALDLPNGPAIGPGPCADLFFSEYVEGSSFNRALELYNPTSGALQLSDYELRFYPDGTTALPPYRRVTLSGTIPAEGTFVLTASGAGTAISNKSDLVVSQLDSLVTGNDAIILFNTNTGDTLDIFGNVGQNPGGGSWAVGTGSTQNHTLVRKDYMNQGEIIWSQSVKQWEVYSQDFTDSLGTHTIYPCAPANQCPNLFISEYIEGSNRNQALEIYNPSPYPVVLNGEYTVKVYSNTLIYETVLDGVIYPNDVFVFSTGREDLTGIINNSDQQDVSGNFTILRANGDDGIGLFRGTDTLDVIGVLGVDPGTSWTVNGTNGVNGSTLNHTLVRDSSVQSGETNWTIGATQWQLYTQDDDSYIGSHYMTACAPASAKRNTVSTVEEVTPKDGLKVYPNPASDILNVELITSEKGEVILSLLDLSGKLIYHSVNNYSASEVFTQTVDVNDFVPGVYFLVVNSGKEQMTTKVIVQH